MNQLSFFDTTPEPKNQYGTPLEHKPLARATDPATSHAAVPSRPKLGKIERQFLEALQSLGIEATAREVAEEAKRLGAKAEIESIRKRSGELERDRWIRCVGTKRCSYTGKMAETWAEVGG